MGCGVILSTTGELLPHWIILSRTRRSRRRSPRIADRVKQLTLALAFTSVGDLGLVLSRTSDANWRRNSLGPKAVMAQSTKITQFEYLSEQAARYRLGVSGSSQTFQRWLTTARSLWAGRQALPRRR